MYLERHFCGIWINSFRKWTYFCEKKLYCIKTLWCTAKLDKFYLIYVVPTHEMAQKQHLWQKLKKSILKMWKPSYDWMISCRKQSEGINYIVMEESNLAWAYSLKALKSSNIASKYSLEIGNSRFTKIVQNLCSLEKNVVWIMTVPLLTLWHPDKHPITCYNTLICTEWSHTIKILKNNKK